MVYCSLCVEPGIDIHSRPDPGRSANKSVLKHGVRKQNQPNRRRQQTNLVNMASGEILSLQLVLIRTARKHEHDLTPANIVHLGRSIQFGI